MTSCNQISGQVNYSQTPDNIVWILNGITVGSGPTMNSGTFNTNLAGVNVLSVELRYGDCWVRRSVQIIKRYEPNFNISQTCNADGTVNVTLHNTSLIFDINQNNMTFKFEEIGGASAPQYGQSATYNNLSVGTHTFKLTISAGGNHNCEIIKTFTVNPPPSLNFTIPAINCKENPIALSIPGGYQPGYTYEWLFAGTSYVVPVGQTTSYITINTSVSNQYNIVLKIKMPNGCELVSLPHFIDIKATSFGGNVESSNSNVCEGSGVTPMVYYVNNGFNVPSSYEWMNGDNPVNGAPNTINFSPTESGNYWPVLIDAFGCKNYTMAPKAVSVTIRKKPYVNIIAQANICQGGNTDLLGVVTQPDMEYQWTVTNNGSTTTLYNWSATTPLYINSGSLGVGTYTYTFYARPQSDPSCGGSKDFIVTVSSPPTNPNISYNIICSPNYLVTLTASGPSNGQYNWSNGMQGQTITTNHGGAYAVTYTAPSGCKATTQIMVPHDPSSLLWVFPAGCYTICPRGNEYVIGPRGEYMGYEWINTGAVVGSGSGFVTPYWNIFPGNHQFSLTSGGCTAVSGFMNTVQDINTCKQGHCKIKIAIESIKEGNPMEVYGIIYNYGSTAVTLNISSGNNYGIFIPSMITIPPGGSYDFMTNPILFYPSPNFTGGSDFIQFIGVECEDKVEVEFPKNYYKTSSNQPITKIDKAEITLSPNPAKQWVNVAFDTKDTTVPAKMILIHDAYGMVKFRQDLKSSKGNLQVDVSNWLQGVYIVTIVTADKPLQSKLLKE